MNLFFASATTLLMALAIGFVLRGQRRAFLEWVRAGELAIENEPLQAKPAFESLPPIVQAYLRKVLPHTPMTLHHIRFRQSGFMALKEGPLDKAFTAEQIVAIDRPAFSWSATVSLAPYVHAQVCDRLIDHKGYLQARLAGVLPIASESGSDLLKGEILRYLAELPWAPWGFLYLHEARWEEVGERLWKLSLMYEGIPVHVLYQFDEQGLIASIAVDDRPRSVGRGRSVPSAWSGRFSNYSLYQGVLIPRNGEVSWLSDENGQGFTYFRGTVEQYSLIP